MGKEEALKRSRSTSKMTIDEYRSVIREAWLPVVKRKKLTSHEYVLTVQWYAEGFAAQWVVDAIGRVVARGIRCYSLGIVRADLEAVKAERMRMLVGDAPEQSDKEWRADFVETLSGMPVEDPVCAGMLRDLLDQVREGELNKDQAFVKFGEVTRCVQKSRQDN